VFAPIFAMTHGLLPIQRRMERVFKHVTLETGLALGLTLLITGVGGSLAACLAWRGAGYGPLLVQHTLLAAGEDFAESAAQNVVRRPSSRPRLGRLPANW
jgi:hypothetical protein